MGQDKDYRIAYSELLNRCWEDPEYLAKFQADPIAALEDFGIPTVPGAKYHIVPQDELKPSTEEDIYLPFQEKPGLRMLGDEMLDGAAGGGFLITKSNIVANQNVIADGTAVGESIAVAVTIAVEVAIG